MWTYNIEKYREITNKRERGKVIRICVWSEDMTYERKQEKNGEMM